MIATALIPSQSMDPIVSRSSNAAGAPLPLIPRRANSATRISNMALNKLPAYRSNISLNIESQSQLGDAQNPHTSDDRVSIYSGIGNDGQAQISIHDQQREAERTIMPLTPERSTRGRASIVSGLEAKLQGIQEGQPGFGPSASCLQSCGSAPQHTHTTTRTRHISEGCEPDMPPPPPGNAVQPRLVRKKSGQLVKPSIKLSTSSKGNLSVVTLGISSRSEPATPMLTKAVHFDPQLEHVKLFLAEQKPLAVSRDGSPTDDTSGTDSDFPSFIYNDTSERKLALSVKVSNMPSLIDTFADVVLEDLSLASEGTSIIGRVRLRNIAYIKSLAVRFTFDDWLTTSEVIGNYRETIDPAFDRFIFLIRLHDILPRIEGKTLIFALRYSVAGRELWDNNKGQNYVATFSQQASVQEVQSSRGISDLRSKLEKVAQGGDRSFCQRDQSMRIDLPSDNTGRLRTSASLNSRYDFENSLKRPWAPFTRSEARFDMGGSDAILWPEASKQDPSVIPSPSFGSPRDLDGDTFRPVVRVNSSIDQVPFAAPTRPNRHHQRSCFDVDWGTPELKLTPSGMPREMLDDITPIKGRTVHLSPTVDIRRGSTACGLGMFDRNPPTLKFENSDSGSDDATPLVITPSASRPPSYLTEKELMVNKVATESSHSLTTDYRQFLSSFCFFTGSDTIHGAADESEHRTKCSVDLFMDSSPKYPRTVKERVIATQSLN